MNAPPPQRAIHSLVEPRPGYGATIEAQPITNTSPNIQAGTRGACPTNWAVTTLTPSPQPFLTHLTTTVKQLHTTRSVLRHIIALADNSTTLLNEELQDHLATLTETLTQACAR